MSGPQGNFQRPGMRPGVSTGPPSSQTFGQPTGTMPGMPPRHPSGPPASQGMPGGMPPGSSQQNPSFPGSQPMVGKLLLMSYCIFRLCTGNWYYSICLTPVNI